MRSVPEVVALCCADLHLSLAPPLARSAEKSWRRATVRQLEELRSLQLEHDVPVLIAGDLFDDGWRPHRCPPELVNLALQYLPERCYGIPGQHDLPHHRLDAIRSSAFWTLVEADRITYLNPDCVPIEVQSKTPLRLHGFPWNTPLKPLKNPHDMLVEIAVVHKYLWTAKTGYPGAPEDGRIKNLKDNLRCYDVVVSGDNHQPFDIKSGGRGFPLVCNVGSFYRRKMDEKGHRPSVGLIYSDNTVRRHFLDVSGDKFIEPEEVPGNGNGKVDAEGLLAELTGLGDRAIDFGDTVRRKLEEWQGLPEEVRRIVLEAMEK